MFRFELQRKYFQVKPLRIRKYFQREGFDQRTDENEVAIETEAGDITVHHGHIWHRVATSEMKGSDSRRITMYIPIVCGKYSPKDEHSFTPIYHRMNIFAKK